MALSKTITLDSGLVAPDAYIRVDSITGSKDGLTFSANSYLSANAFIGAGTFAKPNASYADDAPDEPELLLNPQPYLEQELITFTPDLEAAENFIAQAYSHLKSLPKYAGAVDC